ncbi:hypothetical protein CCR95_02600 [Thiocystis minor]|uniref:hypothetical protein n=1 Tax=Thiocystis minor TaxID=61597 RepID=UPI00191495F9|nr:hypothetical protein [Thiocystis minor]MBK5963010.1 hypothetical protein [Thiocystis minor]
MSGSNLRDLIQQEIDDSRRDGLSRKTAIVIRAENAWDGVGMEYDFVIAQHGPIEEGWTLESQWLRSVEGRRYDELHIVLSHGEQRIYHFDITDFYGKVDLPPAAVEPEPMATKRHPALDAQVKIDQAAIARVLRDPEADALWAEAVRLGDEYFGRQEARNVLAEALVAARILRE